MNSSQEENRVPITPSARPSIHSLSNNKMGRYGLNNSQDNVCKANSPRDHEQESDEVDNVLSKMQKISPLPIRKKKLSRTNSNSEEDVNSEDNYNSDDTLPTENYPVYGSERFNTSNHSSDTSRIFQRELSVTSPIERHTSKKSYLLSLASLIVVVAVAIIYNNPTLLEFLNKDIQNHYKPTYMESNDVKTFENNMDNLKEKYNIHSDLILKLKSGISTIISKSDSASFMFVYNSQRGNFSPTQFDKFINEVAYTAARYLRNNIASIQHSVILSSNLDMQEHGELIDRYKDDVENSGVLLVKEVGSVPSELAMAFHYYCDEYNPVIKRSAIFFTLNVANCSSTSDKNFSHDFVEKCLAGKWKTLPAENIRPLLTRVVNNIIDFTSEF